MLIANQTIARSALRSIRSNPHLTDFALKRHSLIRLALRSASTTTQPSQAGQPPPPPRAAPSSPRPETPALEPQSTASPSIPTESDPSGTIPPTSSPSSPSAAASSASATAPSEQALTWNTYLNLRRIRRRYNLAASITCAAGTTAGGAFALTNTMERAGLDAFSVFGLDPFLVSGMTMLGCGAVGWLLGPVIGSGVFGVVYRGVTTEIAAKEKDFFARIRKHRVDPSSSSAGNPVPDYYGEKIGSVAQYRTWLRDQRAYNKRRGSYV